MARIVDFNINNNKHLPCNTNSCNVVINNVKPTESTGPSPKYPEQVVYNPDLPLDPNAPQFPGPNPAYFQPAMSSAPGFQSVAPQIVNRDIHISEVDISMEQLYKLLAITFSNILKDNNSKLIANIIDNSGKIIVDATSLIKIIALLCNAQEADIHIEYVSKEKGGCTACSKINPIKQIENIKIGFVDFKLGYNDKYNILADTFNVSLKKCIIPIQYGF